jgi:hypothetical protein
MIKIVALGFIVLSHTLFAQPNLIIKGVSKKCAMLLLDKTLVYSALSQNDFEQLPMRSVKALKNPYPISLTQNNQDFFSYSKKTMKHHPFKKMVAVSYVITPGDAGSSVTYFYLVRPTLFGCQIDPVNAHQHFY